jgi:hypothetical protein
VLNKPALPQGAGDRRRRQFRLRLFARARGVGLARFRHPLRHLDEFADIFYNNCFKNGILPITVSPEDLEKLFDDAELGANATLTIDLAAGNPAGRTAASSPSTSTRSASTACSTARRYRAHAREGAGDRRVRKKLESGPGRKRLSGVKHSEGSVTRMTQRFAPAALALMSLLAAPPLAAQASDFRACLSGLRGPGRRQGRVRRDFRCRDSGRRAGHEESSS